MRARVCVCVCVCVQLRHTNTHTHTHARTHTCAAHDRVLSVVSALPLVLFTRLHCQVVLILHIT